MTGLDLTGLDGTGRDETRHDMTNTSNDESQRPLGFIGVDTRVLVNRLRTAKQGELVEYSELTGLIKRNVQGKARSVLESARRYLERSERVAFGVVRDVGLKRLTGEQALDTGVDAFGRHRRATRREARRILCQQPQEELTSNDRVRQAAYLMSLGRIHKTSATSAIKTLQEGLEKHQSLLDKTLKRLGAKFDRERD